MARGRERFNIYCSPCHGRTGQGDGMVVRRGYRRPPTFHQDRLRDAPVGHFFDVMTNGFGAMPDYAAQVAAGDRWAIVAYVRALQLSEHATAADCAAFRAGQDPVSPLTQTADVAIPEARGPFNAGCSSPVVSARSSRSSACSSTRRSSCSPT